MIIFFHHLHVISREIDRVMITHRLKEDRSRIYNEILSPRFPLVAKVKFLVDSCKIAMYANVLIYMTLQQIHGKVILSFLT